MSLILHNPHSILAALHTRPADVLQIHTLEKPQTGTWLEVVNRARQCSLPVSTGTLSKKRVHKKTLGRPGENFAQIREKKPLPLEQLLSPPLDQKFYLALDCLQDPNNVGTLFRTAAFFGVKGIILTQERSAPLTPRVYEAASGGIEYVPFSIQTNLKQALTLAKSLGLWILGSSEHEGQDWREIKRDRSWLLVLGNEEKGMRRLVQESCDLLCRIPAKSALGSLNVSTAGSLLISHLCK